MGSYSGSEVMLTRLNLPPEDGTLEIGDTTAFSLYLRGGAVTEVKRAKTVNHVSARSSGVGCLKGPTGFWT